MNGEYKLDLGEEELLILCSVLSDAQEKYMKTRPVRADDERFVDRMNAIRLKAEALRDVMEARNKAEEAEQKYQELVYKTQRDELPF